MTKPVRTGDAPVAANAFQRDSNGNPSPLDGLSPLLKGEVGASIERILRHHKAEAIGGVCDRKKSTVYRWAADPSDVPVSALGALASMDNDPEFLARVAGHLLTALAAVALAREAQGRAVSIFHEISPGKWGR